MSSKKIIVYPRGFIGFDVSAVEDNQQQTANQDIKDLIRSIKFNKDGDLPEAKPPANSDVVRLWKDYQSGAGMLSQFDFRERIIIVALQAFGTPNFIDWCKLQIDSPYFTTLHKKFLTETIDFLHGKKRNTGTNTWASMLRLKEANTQDIQVKFEIDRNTVLKENFLVSGVVKVWCQQPDGFDDLITTINLFFGE